MYNYNNYVCLNHRKDREKERTAKAETLRKGVITWLLIINSRQDKRNVNADALKRAKFLIH